MLIHLMQEDAQFLLDGTPVMQLTRPGPPLMVQQAHNKTLTKTKYKNPETPHTTLGHQEALDGGN
eukprot:13142202-Ditylum_brightwellii.AAC.1